MENLLNELKELKGEIIILKMNKRNKTEERLLFVLEKQKDLLIKELINLLK